MTVEAGMMGEERFRTVGVLGSGTGLFTSRYWSGFVIDDDILLDAPPTTGIHLRRMGFDAQRLQYVFISHLHADHAFGLAFVCLEFHFERPKASPLTVIGPAGLRQYVETLYRLAYPYEGPRPARAYPLSLEFIEVPEQTDLALPGISFRAVPMDHHATRLNSYGYRLTRGDRTIAYSGDAGTVPPIIELAEGADVLIVECTNLKGNAGDHLNVSDIKILRDMLPSSTRIWVTHTQTVTQALLPDNTVLLEDFEIKAI